MNNNRKDLDWMLLLVISVFLILYPSYQTVKILKEIKSSLIEKVQKKYPEKRFILMSDNFVIKFMQCKGCHQTVVLNDTGICLQCQRRTGYPQEDSWENYNLTSSDKTNYDKIMKRNDLEDFY